MRNQGPTFTIAAPMEPPLRAPMAGNASAQPLTKKAAVERPLWHFDAQAEHAEICEADAAHLAGGFEPRVYHPRHRRLPAAARAFERQHACSVFELALTVYIHGNPELAAVTPTTDLQWRLHALGVANLGKCAENTKHASRRKGAMVS